MSIYESLQLMAGTTVLVLALFTGNLRVSSWLVLIMFDLIGASEWWRHGLAYGDVITACADFALCAVIWFYGKHRWEFFLFLLYQCSMLVSIIDLAAGLWAPGWIDHETYASVLEVINYVAFILLGGVSAMAILGRGDDPAFRPWRRVLSFDSLAKRFSQKDPQ